MTVKYIQYRSDNQISRSLNKACGLYASASYNIEVLLMDMEFDPVASKMLHVTVNTEAAREKVGDIDRQIRVLK